MTNDELNTSYRNLFIMLARHYVNVEQLAQAIRDKAEEGRGNLQPGALSGLFCHAKVMRKYIHELRELLMEHRVQMVEIFGTHNLTQISKQQLRLP